MRNHFASSPLGIEESSIDMKTKLACIIFSLTAATLMLAAEQPQTPPAAGKAAPEFTLTSGEGSAVSLKDYRGKWVVLYFYPKDFTGGCTLEAHNFQRDQAKYEAADAVVLGVSADTASSHKDFCAKEGLNFKLLADADAKVAAQYGSAMEHDGAKMAMRNTFVINPKGEVARVFTGVKPAAHSEEVLQALADLRKG